MNTEQDLYNQLAHYTLLHHGPFFIHQLIVDAFAAQNADEDDKPIKVAFALAGLYLHNEKGFSGREVQLAHMALAKEKKEWPTFPIPTDRGSITVRDALNANPGIERDLAIENWSTNVWQAWKESHKQVEKWIEMDLPKNFLNS